jgi:hypothetical protein
MALNVAWMPPPFMPSYRCEDVLLLQTMSKLYPAGVVAYLPQVLEHWPVEVRTRRPTEISRCIAIRVYEIVENITSAGLHRRLGDAPGELLGEMGRALLAVGSTDESELESLMRHFWIRHACNWLASIERVRNECVELAEWWRADIERLRNEFVDGLSTLSSSTSRTFDKAEIVSSGELKTFLVLMGQLYLAWPTIWEAARVRRDEFDEVFCAARC